MNKGKYVFSRLLDFLDRNDFNYLAKKYDGDKYVKQFTCYNQLASLMFGQLSNRESLRDVVLATQALAPKAYALGFGKFVSDYHIFEEFAYQVVEEAWVNYVLKWNFSTKGFILSGSTLRRIHLRAADGTSFTAQKKALYFPMGASAMNIGDTFNITITRKSDSFISFMKEDKTVTGTPIAIEPGKVTTLNIANTTWTEWNGGGGPA